jgi:hypothetical protein
MESIPSSHPTEQTLSAFGQGKLGGGAAAAVNEHLMDCSECRKRVARFAAAPAPADALPPGLAEHPDYQVRRELGRGGMGVVYLAHNALMGRDEVLKVMGRHIIERPGLLDRFLREIRAVARLRHPNIVTAYSAFRLGDSIVFAMEYVDGLDLARMVKARGPLPVAHACHFVYQAALGLQHAHEEGLVHRDIKPANLMLARKGDKPSVKILDFGLAKAAREQKVDGGITMEGQALGTPDYIAPEQIIDATSADIRADIYSLGGTLYYLLTGHAPFQAKSLYDLYQAHISREADPLNHVRPDVPAELAALVAKMMAKDPAGRFQTPAEVAHALAPFSRKASASGEFPTVSITPRPAEPETAPAPAVAGVPPRRLGPAVLAGAGLGVVVAIALVAVVLVACLKLMPGKKPAIEAVRRPPTTSRPAPVAAVPKGNPGANQVLKSAVAASGSPTESTRRLIDPIVPPREAVAEVPPPAAADGFAPLFNGRNFDGWTSPGDALRAWRVGDGAIRTTTAGTIGTERGDFGDFHLRAELKADLGYSGHLYFRASDLPGPLDGYGVLVTTVPVPAQFNTVDEHEARARTGTLVRSTRQPTALETLAPLENDLIRPDLWFTLEVIAIGPHVDERLDGTDVLEVDDPERTYQQGRIALERLARSAGALDCRKLEIKELPAGPKAGETASVLPSGWVFRSGFPLPDQASSWSYTLNFPGVRWNSPDFDDGAWTRGQAPFGTPGLAVKTPWATSDIWLRRRFVMPVLPDDLRLFLYVRHDEDVAIFVNGKPLYSALGDRDYYTAFALSSAERSLFRWGSNTIAVHGHKATPEQLIDVGLRLVPASLEAVAARAQAAAGAAVIHDGAFAFPQLQSKVLWSERGSRLSVWNDSQFLYVQALLRLDDEIAPGRAAAGTDSDAAYLVLDVDSDNRFTDWRDRVYGLVPTLSHQICVGKGEWSTVREDSKGRGGMRLLPDGAGGWLRVDSFAIPLSEIERKPGETIRLAYWGDSAHLKAPINSIGIHRPQYYRHADLPYERFHTVLLSRRPSLLDVAKVPDDR